MRLAGERLQAHELVLWDHPEDRDCFRQEALVCHDWTQYRDEPLLEQVASYLEQGMPEHFGLWAAGCVARRHTERMRDFGDAWLSEMARWSVQDQVSLPYLLWRDGITPGTFGLDQFDNDLVAWLPHAADIGRLRVALPRLEHRVLLLEQERASLLAALESEKSQHARIRQRRSVRAVLALTHRLARLRRRVGG